MLKNGKDEPTEPGWFYQLVRINNYVKKWKRRAYLGPDADRKNKTASNGVAVQKPDRKTVAGIQRRTGRRPAGSVHHRGSTQRVRDTAKQGRAYNARVKVFLIEPGNTTCWCCKMRGLKPRPATTCHHKNGRGNKRELLMVEALWIPCCLECHMWIHANPDKARALNLLAERGHWNKL